MSGKVSTAGQSANFGCNLTAAVFYDVTVTEEEARVQFMLPESVRILSGLQRHGPYTYSSI
jgi:hypothetical protein